MHKNILLSKFFLFSFFILFFPLKASEVEGEERSVVIHSRYIKPLNVLADFMAQENSLIEGKQFRLWGIGLFAGDEIVSQIIRALTQSHWSHVAVLLKDENNVLYCFQSKGSEKDVWAGIRPQVQISLWENEVEHYKGDVAWRKFKFESDHQQDMKKITSFVKNHLGLSYEKDFLTLLRAISGTNTHADPSSLFCSELAAFMLQHLGYLNNEVFADNVLPRAFSSLAATENDKKNMQYLKMTLHNDQFVKTAITKEKYMEIHIILEHLKGEDTDKETDIITIIPKKTRHCTLL